MTDAGKRERGPLPGRGKTPERITGIGYDELAAMVDLRIRLDERRVPIISSRSTGRERSAFLEGAEAQSQAVKGRPLTADELERVLRRYPGDV